MKYNPPYRLECGSVYEYDDEAKAYVHIYKKSQLTKEEYRRYQKEIAIYDANYDKKNQD